MKFGTSKKSQSQQTVEHSFENENGIFTPRNGKSNSAASCGVLDPFLGNYIIKKLPEDFLVKEISNIKTTDNDDADDDGKAGIKSGVKTKRELIGKHGRKYCYVLLQKRQRNTLDVVKEIARQLRIKEKQIGFAGNKDKQAVTEQIISIPAVFREKIECLRLDKAVLKVLSYGHTPVSLGDLQGNAFEIVVRNLPEDFKTEAMRPSPPFSRSISSSFSSSPETYFLENYFDEQRFSSQNVAVGRALLEKNFKEAAALICKDACLEHLKNHPADFVGALKKNPLRLLRMYVNAFQSALWNKTAAKYLQRKGKVQKSIPSSQGELSFVENTTEFQDVQIPLVGFDELAANDAELQEIINQLLDEEKITAADFVIKQIPELTAEGGSRALVVKVKELLIGNVEDDELFFGRKRIKICFTLPKGSYATMVIKKLWD